MRPLASGKKQIRISIITEVAILFLVGILTTGFFTNISERRLSNESVTSQTELRAAEIANEIQRSVTEYPSYRWLLRYWYAHADTMDIEYDVTFKGETETEEKCRELTTKYPDLQIRYLTEAQVKMLPEPD